MLTRLLPYLELQKNHHWNHGCGKNTTADWFFTLLELVGFSNLGWVSMKKVGGYGCRSTLDRRWLVTGRDLLKYSASPYHLKMQLLNKGPCRFALLFHLGADHFPWKTPEDERLEPENTGPLEGGKSSEPIHHDFRFHVNFWGCI